MIGYMIDNANKRLWIRPRIPSEMNKKIENAILLNPKCLGTLDYDENPLDSRTQTMRISYDKPVTINEFVLKNNTGISEPGVSINNNGTRISGHTVTTEGSSFEKNIRVTLPEPIDIGPGSVKIEVFAGPVNTKGIRPVYVSYPLSIKTGHLRKGSNIHFSVDHTGPVKMELLNLNGSSIGTIMQQNLPAGNHAFRWNGTTKQGKTVGSIMAILRVTSAGGTVTNSVFVLK
jgi:hypothetical protein